MATIARIPVVWSGLPGLPGVSVFYSAVPDVVAAVAALNTWFNANKALFPNGLSWTTPGAGDTLDDATGTLVGSYGGTAGTTTAATGGAGVYASGCGFRVRWFTDGIVDGRRLRGSTFMVPILSTAYDSNGTIQNASISSVQTACNTLVGTSTLRIWARPAPGGSDGVSHEITGSNVPDAVSTLRSRRT